MCVAPRLPVLPPDIAVGNVHASNEPHPAVNDAQLTVVAVVDLAGEGGKLHGHESVDVNTLGAHALVEGATDMPVAHIVVYNPNLHSLTRLVDEHVCDNVAKGVVLENV